MTRIVSFYRAIDLVTMSIGLLLCRLISKTYLDKELKWQVSFIICLVIMIVTVKLLSFVVKEIVKTSAFLRRIILQDNYIEGLWISDNGERGVALTTIIIKDLDILVTGKQYDNNGSLLWTWTTRGAASYRDYKLLYISDSIPSSTESTEEVLGLTSVTYFPQKNGRIPVRMQGFWSDVDGTHPIERFTGQRVRGWWKLRRLRTVDGERTFIDSFIAEKAQGKSK